NRNPHFLEYYASVTYMSEEVIDYSVLIEEAMRQVVRRVLAMVAKDGLPGGHYFYLTFMTQHPQVRMSAHLVQRYPDDMTIVLENQFWDLHVGDFGFSVSLNFDQKQEILYIPFSALTAFSDPLVKFVLQFQSTFEGEEAPAFHAPSPPRDTVSDEVGEVLPFGGDHDKTSPDVKSHGIKSQDGKGNKSKTPLRAKTKKGDKDMTDASKNLGDASPSDVPKEDVPKDNVVSLDNFRKTTE
ncbi:MAG: ClpXP protease specificity-enhancing factor SspB, partial [Pseudomonadota bacterium]